MSEKTINRLALAGLVLMAATLYGLSLHIEYVEARTGKNCETDVRMCE